MTLQVVLAYTQVDKRFFFVSMSAAQQRSDVS